MRLIAVLLIATAATPALAQSEQPGRENAPAGNSFSGLPPGVRTMLTPPPGFSPARAFQGWRNEGRSSWIEVNEISVPLAGVLPDFDRAALAGRHQYVLESRQVQVSGRTAVMISAVERARGITWEHWILVMGNDCGSVVITAVYPQAYADQLRYKLKTALLSTTWIPSGRRCAPPERPPARRQPPTELRTDS